MLVYLCIEDNNIIIHDRLLTALALFMPTNHNRDLHLHPLVLIPVAGPDRSFATTGACNLEVRGSNPGRIFFVIGVVLQTECTVLYMVLCTIEYL